MTTVQGSKFGGPEWKETGQTKAEKILVEELEREGGVLRIWRNAQGRPGKAQDCPAPALRNDSQVQMDRRAPFHGRTGLGF